MKLASSYNVPAQATLGSEDFKFFQAVIQELAGIALSDAKTDLVQSRLRYRLVELDLRGFSEYRAYLRSLPRTHSEWQSLINCLTTNKTDWFREPAHFDFLQE